MKELDALKAARNHVEGCTLRHLLIDCPLLPRHDLIERVIHNDQFGT